MTGQKELLGQTAVVTGSSTGIGRQIALELAAAGANVLVHARSSRAEAEQTAADVRALGSDTTVLLFDLGDLRQQDEFAEQAWQWRSGVDIWINNAGADVLTASARALDFEKRLEALWRVDVLATIRLTRNVGRQMRERGHGTIVNMGWDQAVQGMEGDSGELFAATKGAVMAFTKSAALSLAPRVRVNCVAPGWIKTEWGEHASAEWQERAVREAQLRRWGTPDDVARAVRFLAGPDSSFLDAQVLTVNGGFRPR
jgi:3-oxoacyl-[acyl-carrier protein] reductase